MRGPIAAMAISLDLARAHRVKPYGDLLAVFTWVNDERAIVLLPAHRRKSAWFIVCDSALYKYDDAAYLARMSYEACRTLGMEATPRNAVKIGEIIMAEIPDIIRMPLMQPPEKLAPVIGEAKIFADGRLVGGEEVRAEAN